MCIRKVFTVVLASISCSFLGTHRSQAQISRDKNRDTTLVSSTGGGLWKTPRTAIEELRVVSRVGAYEFGEIRTLLTLSNGGVAVFDAKGPSGPTLVILDPTGRLVRTLGRVGAGPGEFGRIVNAGVLAEDASGNLLMLDTGNNRINRWSRDGRVLPAIVPRVKIGERFLAALMPGPAGSVFVPSRVLAYQKNEGDIALGFIHLDSTGAVLDTLRLPNGGVFTQFQMLSDGAMVLGRPDRLQATLVAPRRSGGVSMVMTHARERVRFLEAERRELDAMNAFAAKQPGGQPSPATPEFKPVVQDLEIDTGGRTVWLRLHTQAILLPEAERVAPFAGGPVLSYRAKNNLFAAFRRDGTWLGELSFETPGFRRASFGNGIAWGAIDTPDGDQVLVKWRLPG